MACNQTAVAILQELCMKRKWNPPMYDVTDVTGVANDPMFEVCVTLCNGIKCYGRGRQKKGAKHDAAKKALSQLQEKALLDVNVTPTKTSEPEPINPHEDVGGGNPVGELQTLCAAKHFPPPEYTVIGDVGEPHDKIFTYKCSVSERSATGTAKKKQLAKHYAARNMLQILNSNLKSFLDEIPNDPAVYTVYSQKAKEPTVSEEDRIRELEVLELFRSLHEEAVPSALMISPGTKFTDYHKAYAAQLTEYKDIKAKPVIKQERNHLKQLEMIAAELDFKLSTTSVQGKDGIHCIVFIHLDSDPPTIQAAQALNIDAATQQAARSVIDFLDTMVQ